MAGWFFAIIALTGAFLNVRGKWQGFLFWLISNAWWCWYNFNSDEYAQALLFGLFWFLSLYGIFQWRKKQANFNKKIEQAIKNTRRTKKVQLNKLLYENYMMAKYIVNKKGSKHGKG